MQPPQSRPWCTNCRWTLGLTAILVGLNLGLFPGVPEVFGQLIASLQFDRQAILEGQLWRLLTGNLVHWSRGHFLLDVAAFFAVGILYEPHWARHYPWLLLAAGLAVGCGVLAFRPDLETYRGLSGVDSGQFAMALAVECGLALRQPGRWIWVAPAAAVFGTKILYECATGQMFFGTESLGDIGQPVPLAHAAGVLAVGLWLGIERIGRSLTRPSGQCSASHLLRGFGLGDPRIHANEREGKEDHSKGLNRVHSRVFAVESGVAEGPVGQGRSVAGDMPRPNQSPRFRTGRAIIGSHSGRHP